jgi:hypothetical protein
MANVAFSQYVPPSPEATESGKVSALTHPRLHESTSREEERKVSIAFAVSLSRLRVQAQVPFSLSERSSSQGFYIGQVRQVQAGCYPFKSFSCISLSATDFVVGGLGTHRMAGDILGLSMQ